MRILFDSEHTPTGASRNDDWFLAYTKPRSEELAQQNLVEQGFDAWHPRMQALARKRAGAADPALNQEALFPRYLFFRPGHPGQSISAARSTRGVCKLVTFGHIPAQLPHAKLSELMRWVELQNQRSVAELSGLKEGQAVQITGGPLAGLQGLVKLTAPERVIVLLEMLGKPQALALPYHQLQAA